MQLKFFTFPVLSVEKHEELINKFLRSVKILEIKRELIYCGENAYWSICVLYLSNSNIDGTQSASRGKVDYKEVLNEEQFKKFCQLRKVRKQIADEDAVPAFAVFTDQELSEVSKLSEINCAGLKRINGVGNKKIEKYGYRFCEMAQKLVENEEGG